MADLSGKKAKNRTFRKFLFTSILIYVILTQNKGKEISMEHKFSNMRIENQVVVVVVVRNADLFVVENGI